MSEPPPPPPPPYGYGPYPPQQYQGYGGYPPQPYWPPPPPPVDPGRLRPPRRWYWLSAIPIAVATIVAIFFVVEFFRALDADIDNFQSNRAAQIDLREGDRAIYIQTRDEGVPIRVPRDDLRCSVTAGGGDGQAIELEPKTSSTIDSDNDSYASEYTFYAPQDGTYRVICEGPEGVRLAVGPDLSFALFVPLVLAGAAFIFGGALSVIGWVVTGVRRSSHKQRLQREWREQQSSGGA